MTGPSQALWMGWKHGSGGAEAERKVHASAAEFLVSSATLLWDGGRMAFEELQWTQRKLEKLKMPASKLFSSQYLRFSPEVMPVAIGCHHSRHLRSTRFLLSRWYRIESGVDGHNNQRFSMYTADETYLDCSWGVRERRYFFIDI